MRIAILDDDTAQIDAVKAVAQRLGHECTAVTTAAGVTALLRRATFDLLILDWMLPESSGLDVVAWVNRNITPPPPMLMVTARGDESDIVKGLEAGADDYVTKPISEAVLGARITALLRRAYPAKTPETWEVYGRYAFDTAEKRAVFDDAPLTLTDKEFALGLVLFRNTNRALSRKYILDSIWGWNSDLSSRTLDMHISRLRSKFSLRPENGFKIASIYSYGYRLEKVER